MYCDLVYNQEWHVSSWITFINIWVWKNINLPLVTNLEILSSVRILKVDPIFVGEIFILMKIE